MTKTRELTCGTPEKVFQTAMEKIGEFQQRDCCGKTFDVLPLGNRAVANIEFIGNEIITVTRVVA